MQGERHYERELLGGISEYLKSHGSWQFYRNMPYLFGRVVDPMNLVRRWQPDALIVRESSPRGYDVLLNLSLPVIYSPATECSKRVTNIVVNDVKVGRLAAEHLYQNGLRNLAFCGVRSFFWSRLRGEGFVNRAKELGAHVECLETAEGREFFSWDQRHKYFSTWLRDLPKPVGILCCTDDFSLLVQEACIAEDLRIPDQVALIGVGNDESTCDLVQISLSSVKLNIRRGGYDAAQYLAGEMEKRSRRATPGHIVIEPIGVEVRSSTNASISRDPEIGKAISFIRKNITTKLSVEDVVGSVNLSRRCLYDRFQQITGEGIHAYIQERRLEKFAAMLVSTELTISEVAYALGESSGTNVARQFKAHYGLTPSAYRQKHST